jgi:hypothetical protein
MPAAASSPCPRPRPVSGVWCPVSGVWCPVRATSVHACLSTGPLSSVRCGRLSVQVSAVRRPVSASGVGVRCLRVAASAVSGRSEVLERGGGQQPYGWDGRGRRGRPLRPCPARGLPESAPRLEAGAGGAGPAERRFGPGRRRGRWLGMASSTAWPTRTGRVHARIVRWWEPVRGEARLPRQADRHTPGESLGRSCRVEPNIKKPIGHIPLAKQN